ncbi:MAG: IS982 family transposase, partial [Meiothermus sp.]|nr:IS982 family transposase [Meiothermus sp.]
DVEGLYLLALDLPRGCELYVDRGYTDYQAEDDLAMAEGIRLRPVRKSNSKRYQQASQWIAVQGRRIIESVGSALSELFPKRIHATTLKGFVLKVWGFIFAHNFRRLAAIL